MDRSNYRDISESGTANPIAYHLLEKHRTSLPLAIDTALFELKSYTESMNMARSKKKNDPDPVEDTSLD